MTFVRPWILLGVILLVLPQLAAQTFHPRLERVAHRLGDDPRWANPDWKDAEWTEGRVLPTRSGVHWVRFRVTLSEGRNPSFDQSWIRKPPTSALGGIDAIVLAAPYAYEAYWNGEWIGGSGVVGASRDEEVVGPLDQVFPIPWRLLKPGEHVLALRVSSFRYNFPAESVEVRFTFVNLADYRADAASRPFFPLVAGTVALVIACMGLVLYGVGDRSRPLLICSLLALTLAAFFGLIALRWLYNAPFDWFYPRLVSITVLMTGAGVLLPWLLMEQFSLRRRWIWFGVLFVLLAGAWWISPIYEVIVLWLCRATLLVSLGIALLASWRRQPSARGVCLGVALSLLAIDTERRNFLSPSFFVSFNVLVLYLFGTIGFQAREARRRAAEATLTAARLESELLKKSLQPHFLLNSLTVLSEVLEQDPGAAARLVDDLGVTFRALARMTGERLVALAQELELCRSHLRIVTLRTGRPCVLAAEKVDENAQVPPAVFLTLIENGLTHQDRPLEERVFRLQQDRRGPVDRYRFFSPGPVRRRSDLGSGGTGLRYVRARLEESFPERWTLQQEAVSGGWETVVSINHSS